MDKIKKVITKDNQADRYVMQGGQSLTPKQVAKKVDGGEKVTFKGHEVHSVEGKYIRSNPDETRKNNLVQKKWS